MRKFLRRLSAALLVSFIALAAASVWFVHHPRAWLRDKRRNWHPALTVPLFWLGNPLGDLSDAMGLTGRDATVVCRRRIPSGEVFFAGAPVRRGPPAPDDIVMLDRGDFKVGWSPKLRHPVWVAYHVPVKAAYAAGKRPNFGRDKSVPSSPTSSKYTRSGYDRGHMAPNYAITTRFGPEAQKLTFLTTNVAPQSPQLNRGVWRDVEHRIADFWTARWGEVWVVVGAMPGRGEMLSGSNVDVPEAFYQVVVAQSGDEIRALALVVEQEVPWRAWPTPYLVSIDEVERRTGLDFLTDLDDATEAALEAAVPTRLWPVRFLDAFRQLLKHNG